MYFFNELLIPGKAKKPNESSTVNLPFEVQTVVLKCCAWIETFYTHDA